MIHADPFAGLTLASSQAEIAGRIQAVHGRLATADPESAAVVSLQMLAFLDRIIAQGEDETPDDAALDALRDHRAMLRRLFGDHIAASRTTGGH
jgi:hypothetical protein